MKKGFTLLELLSVIIVIAVITLIAVPVVTGITTKVRLNALKSSANGLLEASNLYYSEYINTKTIRFDIDDNNISSSDTTNLLSYKGEVKEGTVIINKKGETTLCITDGTNSVYKNYKDKKVVEAANKKCNIPSSTYIVYLDNQATLSELSNEELTNELDELKQRVAQLESNKADQSDLELVSSAKATINDIYPVGSIYITYTEDTAAKVQNKFGGTWEKIEDRFLLSDGDTYTAGNTGGSATNAHTHSVTASGTVNGHALTATEMPYHRHGIPALSGTAASAGSHSHGYRAYWTTITDGSNSGRVAASFNAQSGEDPGSTTTKEAGAHTHSVTTNASNTEYAGSGGSHSHTFTGTAVTSGISSDTNNMPPYLVVYMYKRTA